MSHEPTRPGSSTIKRLFAHSGNRCAFPRCAATLVDGETVTGKICHIKGARPGSARYDPCQGADDRHGFDNLILLCGRHHDVIDDDEEAYTVERLVKMKADHEKRASDVAPDFAEHAVQLLINQPVISVNQTGGVTAHNVFVTEAPPKDETAERQQVLDRIGEFHRQRTKRQASAVPPIPVLDGGMLVMHIAPLQTFDAPRPELFPKVSANPQRFPPMRDWRPRAFRIGFEGLLTGSNKDGLDKPQRAYVQVFRSGTVEAVATSLALGRESDALELPSIQSIIVHYARVYATSLRDAGFEPPFAVYVSLAGVQRMRLVQDFIRTAFSEDLPCAILTDNVLSFANVIFEQVPADDNESANRLLPILEHLANAAQLATSPYFDEHGNYQLKPAIPAG